MNFVFFKRFGVFYDTCTVYNAIYTRATDTCRVRAFIGMTSFDNFLLTRVTDCIDNIINCAINDNDMRYHLAKLLLYIIIHALQ